MNISPIEVTTTTLVPKELIFSGRMLVSSSFVGFSLKTSLEMVFEFRSTGGRLVKI